MITFGEVTNVGLVAFRLQMASYTSLSTVKADGLLRLGLGTLTLELLILISGLVNVGHFFGFLNLVGLCGVVSFLNLAIHFLYDDSFGSGILCRSSLDVDGSE